MNRIPTSKALRSWNQFLHLHLHLHWLTDQKNRLSDSLAQVVAVAVEVPDWEEETGQRCRQTNQPTAVAGW